MNKFGKFVSELRLLLDKFTLGFDYSESEPDFENQLICFSFRKHEETRIDELIRYVRDNLADEMTEKERDDITINLYPVAVRKSFVVSSQCWRVEFRFAKQWQVLEDFQP